MARHSKMQSDPTVQVLLWCGEWLMPMGQDSADIEMAGGDVEAFEAIRAAKHAKFTPAPQVKAVEDGWEDYDDAGWDKLCHAMGSK